MGQHNHDHEHYRPHDRAHDRTHDCASTDTRSRTRAHGHIHTRKRFLASPLYPLRPDPKVCTDSNPNLESTLR